MKESFVLKEVKVLPGLLGAIMDRLCGFRTSRAGQSLCIANQIEMNLTQFRFKANIGDLEGILKAEGSRKKRGRFRNVSTCFGPLAIKLTSI